MQIGHINLARSFNGTGEHFVRLIEALQRHGVEQYVLVRNVALAKRLDALGNVTAGPIVKSAVTAFCLMPHQELVHIHEPSAGQSGLLLALTRSIPYVLTHRGDIPGRNPLTQAVYRRASAVICQNENLTTAMQRYEPALRLHVIPDIAHAPEDDNSQRENHAAAEHLQVYRRASDAWRVPALLL